MKSNTSMLAVALGKITGVAMIAGVSLMSPAALAQPDRNGPEAVTVSQLKEIYLDCAAGPWAGR